MYAYVIMQERLSLNVILNEEESLRLHHSNADSSCGLLGYDNTKSGSWIQTSQREVLLHSSDC